ncbi:hypothetical protein AAVH_08431 [Aphelenchoides avenae]|nr:hypothetical protein AAVH_08431 [Aphelenchus avenae]
MSTTSKPTVAQATKLPVPPPPPAFENIFEQQWTEELRESPDAMEQIEKMREGEQWRVIPMTYDGPEEQYPAKPFDESAFNRPRKFAD